MGRLLLFLLVLLAAGLVAARSGVFELGARDALISAVERVRTAPLLGVALIIAYATAVTFGVPASAFTFSGGATTSSPRTSASSPARRSIRTSPTACCRAPQARGGMRWSAWRSPARCSSCSPSSRRWGAVSGLADVSPGGAGRSTKAGTQEWLRPLRAGALATALLAAPVTLAAQAVTFDHGDFDGLLRAHVRDGLVDYDAFARAPAFERYLDRLGTVDPASLPQAHALAFWINAYNAYTIALIIRHDERKSIRNINRSFGLALKGPWRERLVRVGGRSYSLDEVEHEIIRPRFREPRIHFALVCAALSCPPLRSEAYRGEALEAQLEEQTRRFLSEAPGRNRVDVAGRRVALSPIFDWYKEDFGGSAAAIGRFVARFFPPGAERALLESGQFELSFTRYDWALNAVRR